MSINVCILAAGKGTRSRVFGGNLHKALLPLGNRAAISHIIDQFPRDSRFVVAVGHLGKQVRDYLALAHPDVSISFVDVDNYDGPGSGPGYSLWCCRDALRDDFYFTACDTLVTDPIPAGDTTWLGVSRVQHPERWCTVSVDEQGLVDALHYKVSTGTNLAFSGIAFVRDGAAFWTGLEHAKEESGEWQVNSGLEALIPSGVRTVELGWRDTGTDENYIEALTHYPKNYTFTGKTTDATYLVGNRILKFFPAAESARRRYVRGQANCDVFAPVEGVSDHFFAYHFVDGSNLAHELSPESCRRFLSWMESAFWTVQDCDATVFAGICLRFYSEKTRKRLANYLSIRSLQAEPNIEDECGPYPTIGEMLDVLEPVLSFGGLPSRFHGDLHADNVIITGSQNPPFRLIDWREDFGGDLVVGDRYYDLAKFLHTLTFSVDAMERKAFTLVTTPSLHVENERDENLRRVEVAFWEHVTGRYDLRRILMIEAIAFVNMAPLYDRELGDYLYYLGRTRLRKAMEMK